MRLVMMGTGTFAQPTLEMLLGSGHQIVALVTQPDRAVGQQRGSTRLASRGMKDIAQERNIPVLQPESINTPEGVSALRALSADLLVVAAYGQILSRDLLATTAHGGINVHASLLPKYRGAAPIAWAIYHGETKTGVTIIRMSIYLDAGDILAQEKIDIFPDETAGELETRLGPLGARLALETVERIAAGPVPGMPQDKSQATKAPKLTKEHGLIDWTKHAEQVRNHIRAMQPWPTAYTFLHRADQPAQRLIVCQAKVNTEIQLKAGLTPGEAVCEGNPPRLFTYAGHDTSLEVLELQPAGKRRMAAAEFLRGCPLRAGDRFGPEQP
jgi:methionyl-tRNA formyltransferase